MAQESTHQKRLRSRGLDALSSARLGEDVSVWEARHDIVQQLPEVWEALSRPLDGGAWMREYFCRDPIRGATHMNCWLLGMADFCSSQFQPSVVEQNRVFLNDKFFTDLYEELQVIYGPMTRCLPTHVRNRESAPAWYRPRQYGDRAALDADAKVVYDWLSGEKVSHVRQLVRWQSQGGESFVCHVNAEAAGCWRRYGQAVDGERTQITLEQFQECIRIA